jgi:hypothetical protein
MVPLGAVMTPDPVRNIHLGYKIKALLQNWQHVVSNAHFIQRERSHLLAMIRSSQTPF